MKQNTHQSASAELIGKVISIEKEKSIVELKTKQNMAVDSFGLIHGGFIFGLADYAAMLAVNQPTVVLGKSEVKFLKPVKVGDKLIAKALVTKNINTSLRIVNTFVNNQNNEKVFEGIFECYILKNHVLEKA